MSQGGVGSRSPLRQPSVHNQAYLVNVPHSAYNTSTAVPSPVLAASLDCAVQEAKDQTAGATYQDEFFDLNVYLGSMTHVNVIQDNELMPSMSFGQQPEEGLAVIPQSVIDDLQNW